MDYKFKCHLHPDSRNVYFRPAALITGINGFLKKLSVFKLSHGISGLQFPPHKVSF